MTTLIIDTSSVHCLLALFHEDKVLAGKIFLHENNLSRMLVPEIQKLITENKLTPTDLTAIAGGMGPGSYTGTRVGAAVAKSFSFALKIPFYGFCSLAAFLPESECAAAVIMPSRMQKYFLFKSPKSSELLTEQQLVAQINSGDCIICSHPAQLPEKLKDNLQAPFTPNLRKLAVFLHQNRDTCNSDALFYLHNPD